MTDENEQKLFAGAREGVIMNDQTREPGWYWVRASRSGPWEAREWCSGSWQSHKAPLNDLAEIGPRILPPDSHLEAPDPHLAMLNAGEADRALDKTEFVAVEAGGAPPPASTAGFGHFDNVPSIVEPKSLATPGPWSMSRAKHQSDGAYDYAIVAGGEVIAEVFGRVAAGDEGLRPAEANATLISQAQAMRGVILRLLDVCDRAEPGAFHNGVTDQSGSMDEGACYAAGVFDEARVILRRADGVIK